MKGRNMTKKIQGLQFQSEATQKPSLLAAALRDDGSLQELLMNFCGEDHTKLLLLCQHHGIKESPSMFYQLALALAREIYPEPEKRGRKSKWTALNQGALVVEIERLVSPGDPTHGVVWACQQIAKREPWKSFLEIKESATTSPDPTEALRKVYYNFRTDKWASVMRDAFKMHEHEGTVSDWDGQVTDFVRNPHPK